ncbi:MAG: hypothetical protein GY866_35995 [Proteobacteria bacterium]|nr:hypothetical protein [Pseudomonadota bacterium]
MAIVSLMKLPGLENHRFRQPEAVEIADIVAETRLATPSATISLGCAR